MMLRMMVEIKLIKNYDYVGERCYFGQVNRRAKKFARVNFLQRANLCFSSLLYLFPNFYPLTYLSFFHVQRNKLLKNAYNRKRKSNNRRKSPIIHQIHEFKSNIQI